MLTHQLRIAVLKTAREQVEAYNDYLPHKFCTDGASELLSVEVKPSNLFVNHANHERHAI